MRVTEAHREARTKATETVYAARDAGDEIADAAAHARLPGTEIDR